MRVMILGATGATGKHLVDLALQAGHEVTAYVRSPGKISQQHPRLRIVAGALEDTDQLETALRGQDAVLCALGHARLFDSTPVVANAIAAVVAAMHKQGVRRLVYESAYRAGANPGDLGFLFEWILKPLLLKNVFDDHTQAEAAIARSQVEWIIARPGALTNGPLTGVYRAVERFGREAVRISRADTAHFMVQQLAGKQWLGKMAGLGY